ncbi:MAG: molybdate ABC transporter substrate-binding protein [Fibrobacteres bacterium CG2_30_45_31]|nr:MAG: molybdate ABC transporter substrate-binding protein [Fibrobacteres bacterium CG2_30_45_31]
MSNKIRSRILLSSIIALSASTFAATPKTEIIVSAAASLTETMNELIEMYKKVKPDVTITPTYGSSGSLQQQIEQGAPVDIFISASPKQVDALAKQGLILKDTRKNIVENKVVLIVPKSTKGITQFEDAATDKIKQIALGEPSSVPVGQYSEEIFTALGILDKVKPKAVYAKDVRQVLTYVEMGEVDAGIVYATDAAISKKVTVIATAPEGTHKPVIYPAAVVKTSAQPQVAKTFLAWLSSAEASKVFVKYGFTVVQ